MCVEAARRAGVELGVVAGGAGCCIGERAHGTGNVARALRAAELRLALPFARPVRDELAHALAHLRSRLN